MILSFAVWQFLYSFVEQNDVAKLYLLLSIVYSILHWDEKINRRLNPLNIIDKSCKTLKPFLKQPDDLIGLI